jgi:hypothetical protein
MHSLLSTLLCAEPLFVSLNGELFVESSDGAEDVLLTPSLLELVEAGATLVVTVKVEVLESLLLTAPELIEEAEVDVEDDGEDVGDAEIVRVDGEPKIVVVLSMVTGNTSAKVEPPCVVVTVTVDTDCEGESVD